MLASEQISQLNDLITPAQTIFVIFPANAKLEVQLSAQALYSSLKQLGNKEVNLFTPYSPSDPGSQFPLDEVKNELGNKNLQISFPYIEAQVDKVSYDVDEADGRFYLLIQPQKTAKPLDYKQVEYAYTGAEADLIFLVGVNDYEKLEHLYTGYEQLYADATTVSLNTFESNLGDIKLDLSGKTGLSEAMVGLIESLKLNLTGQAATSLLAGIETSTDGLQSLAATADTFEAVAKLMRAGARRTRKAIKSLSPARLPERQTLEKTPQPDRKADGTASEVKKVKKTITEIKPGSLNFKPSGLIK